MKTALSTLFLVLATCGEVFAANPEVAYKGGIFVNVCIGFCALIVVAQLVPALILILGFIKASAEVMQNNKTTEDEAPPTQE